MQIALGELQKYAGADQRVTVPATTVYPEKDVRNGSGELFEIYRDNANSALAETFLTPSERDSAEMEIRSYWNDNGYNPHWLAVYNSSRRVDRASSPEATPISLSAEVYESNPDTHLGEFDRDQLPVWLVSGNELVDFDPLTATSYDAAYLTPLTMLPDPADDNDSVWVVGEGSATLAADSVDGLDGRVKVKKVALSSDFSSPRGHYAFWVGDESLKANFSIQADDPKDYSATSKEYRNYLQVPQRIGWERMSGFDSASMDPYDSVF
ncbi:MAG: hypothetical protein ACQKBU_09865, partial [Verrucomicrobiales bacterium]